MGFNALNMTFSDKLQQVIAERVTTFGLLAVDMTSTAGYDNDGSTGPELLDNGVGLAFAALRYHPEAKIFFAFGGDQCFYQFGRDEDDAIARLQQSLSEMPEDDG